MGPDRRTPGPTGHIRRLWGLLLLVTVLLAGTAAAQAWVLARVSFYIGEVGYRKADAEEWGDVALKQPLFAGDHVRTGEESRLELRLDERDVIRIDEDSEVEVSQRALTAWKGSGTRAAVKKGKLWSNVRKLVADRENLTVETPTVLAAIRGTAFRIDVPDPDHTVIRVYEGSVEVRDNSALPPGGGEPGVIEPPREVTPPAEVSVQEWLQIVTANQQLTVARGEDPVVAAFDAAQDSLLEWVQWNRQRDAEIPPDRERE